MRDSIVCDLETGICGPTGEKTSPMGFIDLSAPEKKTSPVTEKQQEIEITTEDTTNA